MSHACQREHEQNDPSPILKCWNFIGKDELKSILCRDVDNDHAKKYLVSSCAIYFLKLNVETVLCLCVSNNI